MPTAATYREGDTGNRLDLMTKSFAKRLNRLGTETAFAISAETAAFAGQGNKVYAFHLGDMNIKTPQNIIEAAFRAANDGKTGYCPNYGIPELREVLAEDINRARDTHYTMENVVIQPGGKPSISKFILALMNEGDEVLYPNPGYPIYESQIEFHGGKAVPYTFREGQHNFDLEDLESLITPRTRLLIYNNLQNPTGAESSHEEMARVAELACQHDLYVLCDEAYFDIRFEGRSESLTSFPGLESRCVILYTFSKKFAMTGWRLGAAIGPAWIVDIFAKLNVNHESCSNHFIQYGAIEAITGDQSGPRRIVEVFRRRRDKTVTMLNQIEGIRCYKPNATFYLYPNVTELMRRKEFSDYDLFRRCVLHDTGVSFCTRLHFGRALPQESESYIRLAYSGIDEDEIDRGLTEFSRWADS